MVNSIYARRYPSSNQPRKWLWNQANDGGDSQRLSKHTSYNPSLFDTSMLLGPTRYSRTGEWHERESHLILLFHRSHLEREAILKYIQDYPTPDGTGHSRFHSRYRYMSRICRECAGCVKTEKAKSIISEIRYKPS